MYFLTRWEDVSKKKCITLQVLKVISQNGAIDRWAVAFITMMETTSKHILYVSRIKFSLQGNTTTAATEMDKEDLL